MSDLLSAKQKTHKARSKASPTPVSRRRFLGTAGVAAGAASFALAHGAAAQSAQTATAGEHNASASDPGPQNQVLQDLNPNSFMPPATDHGLPPTFWSSFSAAHRRIQDGGWSRQVTVHDLPISKDIAGVNMRLTAGGIRELHWHEANEWAIMLYGNARLTALNFDGTPYVNDVAEGDLWYFPDRHSAFNSGAGSRGLRIFAGVRRRHVLGRQHHAAFRLDDPYAARSRGQELGGAAERSRSVAEDAAGRPLHLSGAGPSAAAAGPAGGGR